MIGDFLQAVQRDLAPKGTLRAAFNFGNPVVVRHDAGGRLAGLAMELAEELARRLSVPLATQAYDTALSTIEAGVEGAWDLAFLGADPERARHFDFSHPFVVLESTYLVREGSPVRSLVDIDREGVRIAVGKGGFYDLHLSRTLQRAQLVRAATFAAAVEVFLADGLDAVAGLRQPLAAYAASQGGLRVIEGRFAAVEQGIAVPKGHAAGLRYLNAFLDQMKSSGRIAASLQEAFDRKTAALPARRR